MNNKLLKEKLLKIKEQTHLLNLSNSKTLGSYIIVVPAEIKESGITSRVTQFEDRPEIGLVVSIGNDVTNISVDDVVFFGKYSTVQMTFEDVTYIILREEDVYCVAE